MGWWDCGPSRDREGEGGVDAHAPTTQAEARLAIRLYLAGANTSIPYRDMQEALMKRISALVLFHYNSLVLV